MAEIIKMPKLGLTMTEGMVASWRKSEGDTVSKGEIIADISTDKLTFELESPVDGVLLKIIVQEGQVVAVGEPIGIVGEPGENVSLGTSDSSTSDDQDAPKNDKATSNSQKETAGVAPASPRGLIKASPKAKRLIREMGLDITKIKGTGPEGRIIAKDVLAFAKESKKTLKASPVASKMAEEFGVDMSSIDAEKGRIMKEDILRALKTLVDKDVSEKETVKPEVGFSVKQEKSKRLPLTQMRKVIGERMLLSTSTMPAVTYNMEVNFKEFLDFRNKLKAKMEPKGVRISINDILMKICSIALKEYPMCNSSMEGDHILLHEDVNIGLAVAVDGGLVVPNVKAVQDKTIYEIAVETKRLVEAARKGNLSVDDMTGGTFTITNLGMFGMHSFTPIINPPEACILGVNAIVERPVVLNGTITTRPMSMLCLTADHRIIDGADAAKFLSRIKEMIEEPYLMLI
ncbi:MAG: hypothetical protein PWQ32_863 [Thermococcaceae archaeon]|jgi:pyruvate dehydrogenase E2 component (dihydrolipoamide acetyltransferase)|nr:hypothetical protein [Thermococcaceae archaeon]